MGSHEMLWRPREARPVDPRSRLCPPAACAPLVWGGDPTVGFGFDGLESSIYQALSIGTSGVGFWGSDIGGFFALGSNHLTDELLDRWIAFGGLPDVFTLAEHGTDPAIVHLSDRINQTRLLSFPD